MRQLERALGDADAAGRDVDPADLDARHHLLEALALGAAQQVGGGHAVVGEHQLRGLDALVAQLLQLRRHGQAAGLRGARLLLDQQAAHAAVGRLRLRVGLDQRRDQARAQRRS